jgi:hypothetical protein
MLQKLAHTVAGLKSASQPALKSILSRMYLVHASLVWGVVGFIVIVLCLVTGPIIYTVQALVRKLFRSSVSRPRNSSCACNGLSGSAPNVKRALICERVSE